MAKKKVVAIIMLLIFLLSLTAIGCGKKKGAAKKPFNMGGKQQQQKKTIIGVSLADAKDEMGMMVKKGMEQSAKNEKDIQLKFSDSGKDSSKQAEEIDKLIQQKPKVIVLQVVDPTTGKEMVRRIMQQKIKVIAIDKLPQDVALDGYIAPDYTRAGEMVGDFTAKQMVGKPANVLLLQGDTQDTQTKNVTTGIGKSLGGMTMQTTPVPRNDAQMATSTVQQKLTSGGLGAIIATNSELAVAAADAVKMLNKTGQLTVVGVGGGAKEAQSIKSGDLTAVVDTQPMLVAQTAFKAAMDMAKTQRWDYERHITNGSSDIPAKLIPVRLVTKENVFLLETAGGGGGSTGGSSGGSSSGGSSGSSSGSSGGGGKSGGSQGGGQQGGNQKGMTTIIITTEDGRTMRFTIKGKPKSIESHEGGMPGGQAGGGSQGGGSGGGQGGSESGGGGGGGQG